MISFSKASTSQVLLLEERLPLQFMHTVSPQGALSCIETPLLHKPCFCLQQIKMFSQELAAEAPFGHGNLLSDIDTILGSLQDFMNLPHPPGGSP